MGYRIALFNIADFYNKSRFSTLGLGYLAAYLRKNSDFDQIYIIEGDGEAQLRRIKPDLVGIYSVTQMFPDAEAVAKKIKHEYSGIHTIIGGYHISALPYTLPESFDIGVCGEGEETFKEIVSVVSSYGLDVRRLSEINGIVFHDKQDVRITDARGFIADIDKIPFPARDLMHTSRFLNIITSRGCPYRCIFCASVNFWKKPRFHSAEYVVDEIEEMVRKYRAVHISIWDDLFIADKERLEAIRDLILKKKINKKVSFGCALRSNLINHHTCNLLKDINVKRVSFGFETGSQRILDFLKCGSVTIQEHITATQLCKSYGFHVTGTFMLGSPDETQQDMLETLNLIKKLKLDGGGTLTLTVPLPGTKLWEYAKDRNLVSDNMDYSKIGIMSTDFSHPEDFRGVLLTDKIAKEKFFQIAQEIQKETNIYYIRGLLRRDNFSITNIKYVLARPKEAMAILSFLIKLLLRKSSIMDRYIYYYKKASS